MRLSTARTSDAPYFADKTPHRNAYLAASSRLDKTHSGKYRSFTTQHGITHHSAFFRFAKTNASRVLSLHP